ncbi:non-contractile tail sheath protein, partial [Fodinicurvata halophila]
MSYLMSLPAAERYGQIMRFAPDYWQTDFNLLTSASLVSAGDDSLVFRAVYRRNLDLAGAHWASEDTAGHLLHRYEAQPSYRGCSLRFRYRANPETLGLDAFNGPALALETHGGPIHHLRLWNHRVLPNPNAADDDPYDQVIEVVFDDHLYSGFSPPDANDPEAVRAARVPVDDIKRVLLTLPPRSYMAGRTSLAAPLASGDSQVSLAVPSGLTISPGDRL